MADPFDKFYREMADLVPLGKIKKILDENLIDIATNTEILNTPMEYLFDVYEDFIDISGETDNWYCFKCRATVLKNWQKMKPHLIELNK